MLAIFRSYSTFQTALTRRQTIADLTREMDQKQTELSTGLKSDVYKSLGISAAQALDLRASLSRDEAQISANKLLTSRMETMTQTLGSIRGVVQDALDLGVANKTAPLGTVSGLQKAAETALNALISQANGGHAGVPLFAGTDIPAQTLQGWGKTNANTGLAPAEVLSSIIGTGLTDAADATAKIAALDAVFSDSAVVPGWNFEETFYNGSGTGAPRQSATIGEQTVLDYGVQANDPAFRKVIQGLAMLASTDPAQIADPEAYATWVGKAVDLLSAGNGDLLDTETGLGAQVGQVEDANTRMQDRMDLYKSRILDLEGVDSYEAATRISLLETQIQASYAVTARLSQLSFLNYML